MAPEIGFPDTGLGQIRGLLQPHLDHAATDVRAADVDREDAVMGLQNPGRSKVSAADQAGFIGVKANGAERGFRAISLQDDVRARDRQFAESALAESATDNDALGVGPGLLLEKATDDAGKLLRESLDRAVHDGRSLDVVADEDPVQFFL